jgi:hypothetical protein
MEHDNDYKLKRLLHEWRVPDAPDTLDARVLGGSKPWWGRFMSSRVRVPLPVAIAFSVALVWLAVLTAVDRSKPVEPVGTVDDLRGFQPVNAISVRIERSSDAIR